MYTEKKIIALTEINEAINCHFERPTSGSKLGIQIDGYGGNPIDSQNTLTIFLVDFSFSDEIEIIKPKLIVTLGGTATKGLLGLDEPISSLRGKVHDINHCKAIVTYHPSYLLRSKNPNQDKRLVWEDMLMAMDFLKMTISPKQKNYFK